MGSGEGRGGLGCGATMARLILFLVNICFWIAGAAMLGVGIWARVDPTALKFINILAVDQKSATIQGAVWMMIIVGAFIFVIGFLGCCGAWKKSTCMLWLYSFLLLLVIAMQITAVILAIVYKVKVEKTLKESMTKQVKNHYNGTDKALNEAWDLMQFEFDCCGGSDYKDYRHSLYSNNTKLSVPIYCCKTAEDNKGSLENPKFIDIPRCLLDGGKDKVPTPELYLNSKGCYDGLMDWIKKNSGILIGVGVGIAIVEVMALVFACCLKSAINDEKEGLA